MKEIRQKDNVVVAAEVDFKRAAFDRAEAFRETEALCIFAGDLEDWRPIETDNVRARIALGEAESPNAVACRDVEHLRFARGIESEHFGESLRAGYHHPTHPAREAEPHWMFRRHRAAGRLHSSAFPHRAGHVGEALGEMIG